MSSAAVLSENLAEASRIVKQHLDAQLSRFPQGNIREAMRHALRGGKCLRGFLVLESARLHGVGRDIAIWPAAAIEAMHAYSLVHDDLPCMDDDDLRRGQPTVHIKWDEATAVLTGDALQSFAFELLSAEDFSSAQNRAALVLSLAQASGAYGMVHGQSLDIEAENSQTPLTIEEITALQNAKTGMLFEWSAMVGPLMSQADPAPLQNYARKLGLAFQITDDILDISGNTAELGKTAGKDERAGKATFVSLLGLEGAKSRARELVTDAKAALAPYGVEAENLCAIAQFVLDRES